MSNSNGLEYVKHKMNECEHLTLDHNRETYGLVRWICRDCGKELTISEVKEWELGNI